MGGRGADVFILKIIQDFVVDETEMIIHYQLGFAIYVCVFF